MARQKRKIGTMIHTINDPVTGEVLGWLLRWDTGQVSRLMKTKVPPLLTPDPDSDADEP
ncbi:hypothetical protein [Rubellimicrobium aerolatum]|uniref:Uncharacterized protein n=1 Tax=Rubellimicrobium aerolatum TaxID=490979 RepID=A0ABW0SEX8_9RHOB|nr:hypothetical protein [Rubellimicrobium aerolatum]MBP1806998.1 hypothetical protein [Rubellimicrobium aerolatum]